MVVTLEEKQPMSSRYLNLKKSFHLGIRSLLTAFSKEDVHNAFSTFSEAERERLFRIFVQVIKSLHGNIEEEFEATCQETQVGTILDKIEQLVEEQYLDVLSKDKSRENITDVKEKISRAKQDEIQYLTGLLEKTEEENNVMRKQIESLKDKQYDPTVTATVLEKMRSLSSNYERCCTS